MSTLNLKRDHNGMLHVTVDGDPLAGAVLTSIEYLAVDQARPAELYAKIVVPIRLAKVSEIDNVIAFPRPAA